MPECIINVHTHIKKTRDIDARVKLWRECGCIKVCVLVALPKKEDVCL